VAGGVLSYHFGQPPAEIIALTGGVLAGLVLTPDLDVDNGNISRRIVRRSAGLVPAFFWSLFWFPYARIMPHRSHLSHMPVLGTSLRLLYIAILPAMVFWLSGGLLAPFDLPMWGWWAFAGLVMADTLHFVMDKVF
jgi:uncharacterized metal-binding protein